MGRLQHGSSLGNHILVFSREFLAAKTDVRRSVKPGQPRSATLWNNLAGHASASGRACPTLVVRSDAVALTATALAVLEALLWGFHNARSGLAVICRNRKTKTARIAIRAVSFAGASDSNRRPIGSTALRRHVPATVPATLLTSPVETIYGDRLAEFQDGDRLAEFQDYRVSRLAYGVLMKMPERRYFPMDVPPDLLAQ